VSEQQAPPGWYDNTHTPGTQRYWNGSEWTSMVRYTPGAGSAAVARRVNSQGCVAGLVGFIGWALIVFNIVPAVTLAATQRGSLSPVIMLAVGVVLVIGMNIRARRSRGRGATGGKQVLSEVGGGDGVQGGVSLFDDSDPTSPTGRSIFDEPKKGLFSTPDSDMFDRPSAD
jgi:hypothetical protein